MNEQDGFTSVKLQFLCGQNWLKGLINFDLFLNEYIFGRLSAMSFKTMTCLPFV